MRACGTLRTRVVCNDQLYSGLDGSIAYEGNMADNAGIFLPLTLDFVSFHFHSSNVMLTVDSMLW